MSSILVPKSVWKSSTFWLTLVVVLITCIMGVLQMNGVAIPGWIAMLITGLAGIFISSEKLKDGKEAATRILTETKPADLLNLKKPLVNENASKYLIGIGITLDSIIGVLMSQEGVVIDPWIIGALNTIIGTFVGFDKIKAGKIKVAEALVKKKVQ